MARECGGGSSSILALHPMTTPSSPHPLLKKASKTKSRFVVGSHVWIEDADEAWMDGQVEEVNGEDLVINCTNGKKATVNLSTAFPKDTESPRGGVEDMTRLAYLHEPGVLQNLKSRYALNEIYTYTGNILIAVNPFQRLPHLYNNHMMGIYKGAEFGELSPHPFAITDRAYRLMINDRISQAILVSGESGAGKTESTKSLMQYLAFMGGKAKAEGRSVQEQILESNPVLEAFGNAKTVRNNNSSRFGKFVEIQFDQYGKISGAAIRTYLLERSRVCQISDPERNYHCFYMLCASPPEDRDKFKVGEAKTFHYLNQSNCIDLNGFDDSKEYIETRRAMGIVGMSNDEQDAIFKVVAAILHLGNIEFGEGSEPDSSAPKDDKSKFHLKTAAELFMCDAKGLEESLCKRVMATRGESITKNLDAKGAALSRDALSRIVYSRLFDWLVNKINSSIGQDPDSKILIGVLDIYGFESFKTNSFEQFCINLTNEKLQQHFNQHVFKMEQEEYTKEEIDWSYIQFVDNQEILDLIEKKPGGIIALLDETCMLRNSTHETFAEKLYQKYKDNPHFSKPKFSRSDFTVHHYAGNVTYQTDLFLDKNIDYAVNEHQILLNASKCPFVSSLFPPVEEAAKNTKFTSIGSSFKQQLQSLLETLSATEPHYIRCIKPNNVLKPAIFENSNVLQQLRCGGVLEAIRISCLGYPTRRTFYEFVNRFGILHPKALSKGNTEITSTKMILEKANLVGYQIGKTKVFLRAGQMAELDALRTEVLGLSAKKIQTKVRSFLCRKKYVELRTCATQLEAVCRGTLARRLYENLRRQAGALRIQTRYRMRQERNKFRDLWSASTTIQCGLRGMAARKKLRFCRQTKAAVIIQTRCRCHLARSRYVKMLKATLATQCRWRGRIARKELRQLKMAAKETGALQAAKSKLEKEVEELTWRLQVEKRIRSDLEEAKEAKIQENKKLQSQLQELQQQFKETKELLKKEQETSKAASEKAEKVTLVPEIRVDETQVNELTAENEKLTAENEKLKTLVSSLETKIEETEERFKDQDQVREESLKKATEAESQLNQLKNAFLRFFFHVNLSVPADEQQESVEALINCVNENIGFSEGKPVAAITIYKCLLHWRTFEAEKTNIFDRLIQIFSSAMQKQDSNADLAYWLSNASSLLIILQKSLKPAGTVTTPLKRTTTQTSFLGRMARRGYLDSFLNLLVLYDPQVFRASSITVDMDLVRQVEGKYPAFLFKQQLTAFVEGLYGMIRDNVKREVSSVLSHVIQVTPSITGPQVPTIFCRKIFTQLYAYINAQLFNSLLVRRECCSFSNGEYVKQGIEELEAWCTQAKPEVIFKKFRVSYDEIMSDLCPVLSVHQLYRICTQYWDDKYNTESVSEEVLNEMKTLVNEGAGSGAYLLDEETSMPLSLEEIGNSMDTKEFQNVVPPQELLENASFQFLKS
uniref:Myosin-J heavy chain n=1 Tax=Aegilops tauschii TaxID=37682 RepID=M8BWI6_AEGTA